MQTSAAHYLPHSLTLPHVDGQLARDYGMHKLSVLYSLQVNAASTLKVLRECKGSIRGLCVSVAVNMLVAVL